MGTMQGATAWAFCGLVLVAAMVGKFGGCTLAARLSGLSWRRSSAVGVMMNTRGLMELIVINLGYELGVIPKSVFFMLVVMAVVTTYMTSPILRRLIRGTELQPLFDASPFNRAMSRRAL
jgi:Kef-type K+ transport system membrane component KefB